jgi:predicted TIM-barrel enzyme
MSGSGGGNFGGGGYEAPVSCARLVIVTQIASPKASVVAQLQVGSVLTVGVEGQAGTSVIVLFFGGQKAGGIASAKAIDLRTCIEEGTQYTATVQTINNGQVVVKIKAG